MEAGDDPTGAGPPAPHRVEVPVDVTYFAALHALDICLAAMIGSKADLIADVHVEGVRVFGQAHVPHTPDGDAATEPGHASPSVAKPIRPKSTPVGALPAPASGEPGGEVEAAMALVQQVGTSRALAILRVAVTAASSSLTSQGEDTKRHESSTVVRTAGARRRGRPALPSKNEPAAERPGRRSGGRIAPAICGTTCGSTAKRVEPKSALNGERSGRVGHACHR